METGRLQQREGAHHVGAREGERIDDRAVDVALGRQVDDRVDVVPGEEAPQGLEVAYVAPLEDVVGLRLDVGEVGQVARIGEFVEVDDAVVGIFADEEPRHVRADEPGAAGYEDVFHCRCSCAASRSMQ